MVKINWYFWFNPANYFLLLLIGLTFFNCYLSLQISQNGQNSQIQDKLQQREVRLVRVLQLERTNFGQLDYFVWSGGYNWRLTSGEILRLGHEYLIEANFQPFAYQKEGEKFANYELSLGINGEILKAEIKFKKEACDLECRFWQTVDKTRSFVRDTYRKNLCGEFKFVSRFLASNIDCSNIFGLSVGLVLGGTGDFSKDMKANFKLLGLSHLVAVSGFQVVMVVNLLENWLLKLQMRRNLRLMLIFAGIFGLILLVGPQPPVLRSGTSITLSMLALWLFGRKLEQWRALIYSALVLLWLNPFYLISISFQLSFVASLGLVVSSKTDNLAQVLAQFQTEEKNQNPILQWLQNFWELLLATVASFLFTLPIIVNLAGQVSPAGILTNLLIVPIIPLITYLNLLGLLPVVGGFFLILANILQSLLLLAITDLAKGAPLWRLSSMNAGEIAFYYAVLISFLVFSKIFLSPKVTVKTSLR